MQRRNFLRNTAALSFAATPFLSFDFKRNGKLLPVKKAFNEVKNKVPEELAADEDLWKKVIELYPIDKKVLNMGSVVRGVAPYYVTDGVIDTYLRINEQRHGGNYINEQLENVRKRLATWVNCSSEELAVTRNTTDGITTILCGYPFKDGDEIITTRQEHAPFYGVLHQLKATKNVIITTIPTQTTGDSAEDLLTRIHEILSPKTKLIHLCHVYLTGHVSLVSSICKLAKERNIRVLVDGALAVGHIPVNIKELDCDYYAGSLHKWAGGPRGTGFLFIRKNLIPEVLPLYGYYNETTQMTESDKDDIRKFESIGTHPESQFYTITNMLDLLEAIGIQRIQYRLRYLTECWKKEISEHQNIRFCVNPKSKDFASLFSFKLANGAADIPSLLWHKHKILLGGAYINGQFGKPDTWDEIILCNSALFHSKTDMQRFGAILNKELA